MRNYAPPAPPRDERGALRRVSPRMIVETLEVGRYSGCCVCAAGCFQWWSPSGPGSYVPLHDRCAQRLVEMWVTSVQDGTDDQPKIKSPRRGAYARQGGVDLSEFPPNFSPGPHWRPGDGPNAPWTVDVESATGRGLIRFDGRGKGEQAIRRLAAVRIWGGSAPVVGACLSAPNGNVVESWGEAPKPGSAPRWSPIWAADRWYRCTGCGKDRWPGTWTEGVRCLPCLTKREVDDPRPPLQEPARPASGPPKELPKVNKKKADRTHS